MNSDPVTNAGDDVPEHATGAARRRAGELSGRVLDVLRQSGAALTPTDVQRRLSAAGTGPLAYTTVVTILSRLHGQGLAERFRAGRAYAYRAVEASAVAARRMRRVLDDQPDHDAVLATFVNDLSPADERLLRALLRDIDAARDARPGADDRATSGNG
ncbi:MAG TPA: BlaI/MecI/CopY family transcriptional regulator [Pseudonocardiaceae bacterium]|nr:BlaI/MecI/CopY family transcriptional regulator [Pseudonocardiaceae bacterium]